jgi:hypothetical protein
MIIGKDEMVLLFTLVIVISKVALYRLVGFEVIITPQKIVVYWGVILCSPLKVILRFGGSCHLHLLDRRLSKLCLTHVFTLISCSTHSST